jgi:hypothetical protein
MTTVRSLPQLRIAIVLGIAATIATMLLFPYVLALEPGAMALASAAMHMPAWAVVGVQSLRNGVVCFLLAWAGLKLGASLGLGAPWLGAALYGRARPVSSAWSQAALLGIAAALLVIGAILLLGAPIPDSSPKPHASLGFALKGLLASPYGAIAEEVELRVFAMGLFAWLLSRLAGKQAKPWVMIAAIVLAALVFGAGHLPMAAKLVPLTAGVVARVVAYNALAGLVFGWLYWKRGLEHAMLAHFSADLVLHVAAPLMA